MTKRTVKKQSGSGFTLVELAIVIVVIGLITVGILKGQEMIRNAKVAATITFVQGVKGGTNLFADKYGGLPGDLQDATNKIKGCQGLCINGDGNSVVGPLQSPGDDVAAVPQAGVTTLPGVETSMFWRELVLADIINGVNPQADIAAPVFGETHPASKVGGGFEAVNFARDSSNDWTGGLSLRLQALPTDSAVTGAIVPTQIAKQIDDKMDDGLPDTGHVAADFGVSGCDSFGEYQVSQNTFCVMYFNIK